MRTLSTRKDASVRRSIVTIGLCHTLWLVVLTLGFVGSLRAQSEDTAGESSPADSANTDATLRLVLASPQACFERFTQSAREGNWQAAVDCLDFSAQNEEARAMRGEVLAYRLDKILQTCSIDSSALPDDASHDGMVSMTAYSSDVLTGEPFTGSKLQDVELLVIAQSSEDGLWRFSPGTIQQIDQIFRRWQPEIEILNGEEDDANVPFAVWLQGRFPERFHATHFLIEDFKWICLATVLVLGLLADAVVGFLAHYVVLPRLGLENEDRETAFRQLWKPIGLLVQAAVWYFGTRLIDLPTWATYIAAGLRFFAVFAAVWVAFRLIDFGSGFFARRAELTSTRFDDVLVPLASKSLKVVAILLGVLACAETFHLPITGLLGGLGLGGMALALASRDAVSNFFGSLTVLVDRPFEVGDWVITENIEGTVETVGFRSTRVRTFYNSLVTLPNSRLTTAVVDNMGRRRYRRVKTVLGLEYGTPPDRLEAFCEGVRELIRKHPNTRKDYFHVYFQGFNESSLDILLYFFLKVPDWSVELRDRHALFADILRLAQELNVQFAFPSRTVHIAGPADGRPLAGPDGFR